MDDRYPARPLHLVVPFGEGPTAEQARWLAAALEPGLAQPVRVETVPGRSGTVGTARVAAAAPDGYTLLAANPGPLTVGPHFHRDIGYDPLRDFSPVVLMATVASVVAVHPGVPVRSIDELIALARMRPGGLRYGSPGAGTVGHLAMVLFQDLAQLELRPVHCDGLERAVPQLAAGAFEVLVIPVPQAQPLARVGRIRALAVTHRRRCRSWPDLFTVDESGLPGFESFNWNGLAVPAGTPPEVVARLNAEINAVLVSPAGAAFFAGKGYEVAGGTPAAFGEFLRAEWDKWGSIARRALPGAHSSAT